MTVVALGPKGKPVEIPDDLLAQYDAGKLNKAMLYFHAVKTRQGRPEDFGLPNRDPEITGPMNAAMISAGKEVSQLGSNAMQLLNEVGGNKDAAQEEIRKQAEADYLTAPVSRDYPKSAFAGRMLPYMAVPGGVGAQVTAGVVSGALSSDTTEGRIANAALGGLMAYAGQKAGEKVSNYVVPKVQKYLGSAAGAARETLTEAGVPLTIGQKGSASGRFVDVLKSTLTRGQPLQKQQISVLNKLAANAIGENADNLSKPVLASAANRIGDIYESVAKNVGEIAIGQTEAARFAQIDDLLKAVPEPSKVTGALTMVEDMITNPKKGLTGASYNALRHKLGQISSQLWKQGSGLEAEVIDETIDTLDGALATAAPKAAEELAKAGQQWKFLVALRRGASINDLGNINPKAMAASLEAKYPGFDIGRLPTGKAGEFGKVLDAYNQVVIPFKSSGTAERLAGVGAPILAGLGLAGLAGPATGPAAALAAALAGGGAGPQIGGGLARSLATQPKVTNTTEQLARKLRQIH